MGSWLRQPMRQNRRRFAGEAELGLVPNSRQINDLGRIQAQITRRRPDLRLSWVLLARPAGGASVPGRPTGAVLLRGGVLGDSLAVPGGQQLCLDLGPL